MQSAAQAARVDFPDPTRAACPGSDILQRIAARDPTVDDSPDVIGHIATCSPCFIEYSGFRDSVEHRTRMWRVAIAAAACLIVVASVIGVRRAPVSPVANAPVVAKTEAVAPVQPVAMTVDLGAYSPTRGSGGPRVILRLPLKLVRLTLQMPVGLEAGSYQCRIVSGPVVLLDSRVHAELANGIVSFEIDLDLATTPHRQLTLMIRPPELSWRSYPISVQEE